MPIVRRSTSSLSNSKSQSGVNKSRITVTALPAKKGSISGPHPTIESAAINQTINYNSANNSNNRFKDISPILYQSDARTAEELEAIKAAEACPVAAAQLITARHAAAAADHHDSSASSKASSLASSIKEKLKGSTSKRSRSVSVSSRGHKSHLPGGGDYDADYGLDNDDVDEELLRLAAEAAAVGGDDAALLLLDDDDDDRDFSFSRGRKKKSGNEKRSRSISRSLKQFISKGKSALTNNSNNNNSNVAGQKQQSSDEEAEDEGRTGRGDGREDGGGGESSNRRNFTAKSKERRRRLTNKDS